jgi:iron complex outermembrane receptor protein
VNYTSILAAGAGLAVLSAALPAHAQSAGGDAAEIVVTARKRAESILTVPVIANVLTEAQLERTQVTSLDDIATIATGLVIGQQPGELGTQVAIRGVGTNATDPGIDQSVSLNIDGMQLGQGLAYTVGLFDMAQIEVLKGPQALFFGKNSPGGVIAIRTADPGNELDVIGRLGYEVESRNWRGEAIVSGPVTDTLGVRLAAMYSSYDGFYKNTAVPLAGTGAVKPTPRFGGGKSLFLRGTAVFKPTDRLTARLKVNYTRDRLGYVAG